MAQRPILIGGPSCQLAINKMKNKIILTIFAIWGFSSLVIFASESLLSKARVSYRADGGISITYFLSSACEPSETEGQCMDRVFSTNAFKDLPYDDVSIDQLPQDRESRDKWRGSKGQGIWVDQNLVTKSEKIEELKEKLDEELEKDNPDTGKVLKLQHQLEKAKDIKNSVLTQEDLSKFEERQQSFLAAAVTAVGELFEGILNSLKEGILALKSLVTDKIQVGTSEKPSGITTYDHETGEPYCLIVKKGKVESIPGECGDAIQQENDNQNNNENNGNNSNNAEADTEPPVITLIGNSTLEIEVNSIYSDPGATVSDNVNDNLGYKVKLNDGEEIYPNELVLDTSIAGEHTLTYVAVDQAGNIGTATRTINVVDPYAQTQEEQPQTEEPTEEQPVEEQPIVEEQPSEEAPPQEELPAEPTS